jgi:hypothetical protein
MNGQYSSTKRRRETPGFCDTSLQLPPVLATITTSVKFTGKQNFSIQKVPWLHPYFAGC